MKRRAQMRAEKRKVLGVIAAVIAVLAGLAWAAGGLVFAKHETDMLHLIDIVMRQAGGARPHLDFETPLGVLAFAPFVALMRAGLDLGAALAWGQILFALALAPLAFWAGASRLGTAAAAGLALAVLLLAGGMVHGGTDPKISLSMHYNRWAWALTFPVLIIAALPRRQGVGTRGAALADGLATGLAMAALALIKATFFLAFAPAVIAGLVLRREGAGQGVAGQGVMVPGLAVLGIAVLAGLGLLGLCTAIWGAATWPAYMGDLLRVAGSDLRAAPAGSDLAGALLDPAHAPATLLALFALVKLRAAAGGPIAAVLALALPGALYVTWQNYGNDPLWLVPLWLILMSLPEAARGWRTAPLAGALALALIAPVALNIAVSPVRQVTLPRALFAPVFPGAAGRADVLGVAARMERVEGRAPLPAPAPDAPDGCTLAGGAVGWMRAMADGLERAGLAGTRPFVADLFNELWLFGDFAPLRGGAPWYYGGLPGIEDADLLVVPKCPIDRTAQAAILKRLDIAGKGLRKLAEDPLMVAYRIE